MRAGLTLLLGLLPSFAFGWADAGHKIIASLAYQNLAADARLSLTKVLEQHPRFQDDFVAKMPEEVRQGSEADRAEWIFHQAAVWPDLIREFRGENRQKYHRATWHYINTPIFLSSDDEAALADKLTINVSVTPPETAREDMNVIQFIAYARHALVHGRLTPGEQAVFLCWLLHTVGDIHQPCHATACFTRTALPEGDRGANRILTRQHGNLHAVWDLFPGSNKSFRDARNEALTILRDEASSQLGAQATATLDGPAWLKESRELSLQYVYQNEVRAHLRQMELADGTELAPLVLSEEYLKAGGNLSRRRLVEAGYRLGKILAEVAPPPTSPDVRQ